MTHRNKNYQQSTEPEPLRAQRTSRRRLLVLAFSLAMALVVVLVSVVARGTVSPNSNPITLTPKPDPSTTTTLPQAKRTYTVGEVSKSWAEADKTVVVMANGQTRSPRVLVAHIFYPAAAPGPNGQRSVATPAQADGPFPLLIFGPGFEQPTMSYKILLEHWARSGFVVAALTFPGTAPGAPGGATENDLIRHFGYERGIAVAGKS